MGTGGVAGAYFLAYCTAFANSSKYHFIVATFLNNITSLLVFESMLLLNINYHFSEWQVRLIFPACIKVGAGDTTVIITYQVKYNTPQLG